MTTRPGRLIIVTSQLPMKVQHNNDQTLAIPRFGDMAAAITTCLDDMALDKHPSFSGVGWAGTTLCKPADWETFQQPLPQKYTWIPVFLPARYRQILAKGFADTVLWPLFHYFPSYVEFSTTAYEDYFHMNRLFAERLQKYLRPGDTVWIHDHRLLLLAGLLRQGSAELTIGLFLHISYPSFEIFRHLPGDWQQHILHGMLGADLIGFQTSEYATLFRKCVRQTFSTGGEGETIEYNNRMVQTGVFPVGIDYSRFNTIDVPSSGEQLIHELQNTFKGKKIIFSIDTLDYTKGILDRIKAYEYFLQRHPDYQGKVTLILVIIPSSELVSRNAEHKKLIDQAVSNVNGKFASLQWQPLFYLYKSLKFEELLPLYRLAIVALLTPLRDAMNLYAKEFVASRNDETGVLILSERDGAAEQLTGAIAVNPKDIPSVADAIKSGLEMPEDQQRRRMRQMREAVSANNIFQWGKEFLSGLENAHGRQQDFRVHFLDSYAQVRLLETYRAAHKRQLLLDYDGTLMPFFDHPEKAKPAELVLEALSRLTADSRNSVYIISGRDGAILDNWLGHLPIHIVAEHGAQVRYRGKTWESVALPAEAWKDRISRLMQAHSENCPGSFVEEKLFSVVWHYRSADPRMADDAKMRLYSALSELTAELPLQVTVGKKIIEVRNKSIDKGSAVRNLLEQEKSDFILAIGDDRTDEDMFRALANKKQAFSIKVGQEPSFALYNIPSPQSVLSLLNTLGRV